MKRIYKGLIAVFVLISFKAVAQQGIYPRHKKNNADINADDSPFRAGMAQRKVLSQAQSVLQIVDSIYRYNWDVPINGWAVNPTFKLINIVYDAQYNLTSSLWQHWNGSAWDNYGISTYSYDANNNRISKVSQMWNGSAWENNSQITFTYDGNDNETGLIWQNWNNNMWVNSRKDTNFYDINNNLIHYVFQSWNNNFNYWINNSQDSFTYDASNNLIHQLTHDWNGTWVNDLQYFFTCNANNLRISELEQLWSGTNWIDNQRGAFNYDVNNNLIEIFYQMLNGGTWVNNLQVTYTYDSNNLNASFAQKFFNNTGNVITGGDSTQLYFHTVTGINDLTSFNSSITIHPNPTTTSCTITAPNFVNSTLFIYDITGRALSQQPFNSTATINISHLTSGIYIAAIKDKEGNSVVTKVVRE